jgi:hypothetical protein
MVQRAARAAALWLPLIGGVAASKTTAKTATKTKAKSTAALTNSLASGSSFNSRSGPIAKIVISDNNNTADKIY